MNRQDVISFMKSEFGAEGEQLWAQFPNYTVFRNGKNKKWFGIIMDIERSKLGIDGEGLCDILVIKCDPILIGSLINNRGYLPAYHISKKSWITVLLDSSAPPAEEIKDLIHLSYDIIDKKRK